MKSLILFFTLCLSISSFYAQQKYLFMRDALYQDSNYCAFLIKPGNNLIIGQIINVDEINLQLADSLGLESFVFPVGLDSNKIVGFTVKNLASEFNDNETIERWGTSRNRLFIKPSAINRVSRRQPNTSIISVNEDGRVTRDTHPFYENQINNSRRGYTRAVNFDKIENNQFYFSTQQNKLYVFNTSLTKIIGYDYLGNTLFKSKINIEKPAVYSNKGKYLLNDKSTQTFYLIIQTNFAYNIYLMHLENGETTFLESIAGVWENPTWRIDNGLLTYQKEGTLLEMNLNEKGAQ
ncbi:MAG: hypothetical protein ACPGU5_02090 [Lishizhenia sp.]